MKFTVSCIGARQHYAVPRAFKRLNLLKAFYTDIWARNPAKWKVQFNNKYLKRYASRFHPELEDAEVHSIWQTATSNIMRILPGPSRLATYDFYAKQGKQFALGVSKRLQQKELFPSSDIFFGFTSASLETQSYLNKIGIDTILDQIDPGRTEANIVEEEREHWPGWDLDSETIPNFYFERVEAEWNIASMILVNSAWTKSALVSQGIEGKKIIVIPQAFESPAKHRISDYQGQRPLRVLWVGSVILRKGIPYLIEAAKILGPSVEIKVVGRIGIAEERINKAPSNVNFVGSVPRSDTDKYYQWADVCVLPTLSDGFAMTQLEAISFGVPVITTKNCGEVVSDGQEGWIIPIRDSLALAAAIERMIKDPELVQEFSKNCLNRVKDFSLEAYGKRLVEAILKFRGREEASPTK